MRSSRRLPRPTQRLGGGRVLPRLVAMTIAAVSVRALCFTSQLHSLGSASSGRGGLLQRAAGVTGVEVGQTLDGTIKRVFKPTGYFVDIGTDTDALLSAGEIRDMGLPGQDLRPGEKVTTRVLRKEGQHIYLTLRSGDLGRPAVERWHNRDITPFVFMDRSHWVEAEVEQLLLNGLIVKVSSPDGGEPVRGKLNKANFVGDLAENAVVGKKVQVRLLHVNEEKKTLEFTMQEAAADVEEEEASPASHGGPVPAHNANQDADRPLKSAADYEVGETVTGRIIRRYDPVGYWVDIGADRDAWLSAGEIREGLPKQYFRRGDQVTARVLGQRNGKVDVTMRPGDLERPHLRPWRNSDVTPWVEVDSSEWLEGEVLEVLLYGVFVKVDAPGGGAPAKGMLHKSKFRGDFVDTVTTGSKVRVRLLSVDVPRKTIEFTMWDP